MTPDQYKSFHLMMTRLLATIAKVYKAWVYLTYNLRDEEEKR